MAHKKGEGSTANGRDSHSKRLGVKLYGGQTAIAGNIIIRQRGTKFHPGLGVGLGKDHTIFATTDGIVNFRRKKNNRCYVNVLPFETEAVTTTAEVAPKKATRKKPADDSAETATLEAPEQETPAEETDAKEAE